MHDTAHCGAVSRRMYQVDFKLKSALTSRPRLTEFMSLPILRQKYEQTLRSQEQEL